MLPWTIGAILAVGFVCAFHWYWALMACNDDSGSPNRTYLDTCWAYETYGGWKRGTGYFIFSPLGLVVLGSLIAVSTGRMLALGIVAIASLCLALAAFLTGPLLFS